MTNVILLVLTVLLCGISFYLFARDLKIHPNGKEVSEEVSYKEVFQRKMIIYSVLMVILTIGAAVLYCIYYRDNSIFTNIKRLSLLCLIWPLAYIDYTTYRIPNAFIIFGLVLRVAIFPFELLFSTGSVWMTLLSEVIASAALFIAAILCSIFVKDSIGFGDIKLFIVMGLYLSLDGIWGAIFLSLIVSFFVSLFLLVTKKKGRKDAIPFAPAIVVGTYLSVCLTGM